MSKDYIELNGIICNEPTILRLIDNETCHFIVANNEQYYHCVIENIHIPEQLNVGDEILIKGSIRERNYLDNNLNEKNISEILIGEYQKLAII